MLALAALAATAAVLCGPDVVLVRTDGPAVVRRAALPGEGVAVFAAPDRRVFVPLAATDQTAVVAADGTVSTVEGRFFPLFFDEPDRMLAVLPGSLLLASYPERLPLERMPLAGVTGAWRAACSRDGRMAAVITAGEGRRVLVLAGTRPGTPVARVGLPAPATALAVAPDGGWVAVGLEGGRVCLASLGRPGAVSAPVAVGGEVGAVAVSADGRVVVAGARTSGGGGSIVGLAVRTDAEDPLKVRFSTPLPAGVRDVAVTADGVVAVAGEGLAVLDKGGRRLKGMVPLSGPSMVVVLPERATSTVPAWSDRGGQ